MTHLRVGIIGSGRPWRSEGATGFGMGHLHALGYRAAPDTSIVAVADINQENARAFQEAHGVERAYQDYHEMLRAEQLDIVSVCTWPRLHADMVIAAAESGVRAIHCEKPMAPTFGEARRMVEICAGHGVQLTFNHQRRFAAPFRKARELLRAGAIGRLERLEATCPDMFDWGTHWFDMLLFYNNQEPVEWVMGQVEPRGGHAVFGVQLELQGISQFLFRNGVRGLLETRADGPWDAVNRLVGESGTIEVRLWDGPPVRMWAQGQTGWETVPIEQGEKPDMDEPITLGVLDLIDALRTGREPELSARRALQATELIFATYESSRRRGRVDLPLTIEDSPLAELIDESLRD